MDDGGDWGDMGSHDTHSHDAGDHHHDDGTHFDALYNEGKVSDKLHDHLNAWFRLDDEVNYAGVESASSPKQSASQRFHNDFVAPKSTKALVIRHKYPENLHKAITEDEIIKSLVDFAKKEANENDDAFRKTLSESLESLKCSKEIAGVIADHMHHVAKGTHESHMAELFAKHPAEAVEEAAKASSKLGKLAIIGGSVALLGAVGYWLFRQKHENKEPQEMAR